MPTWPSTLPPMRLGDSRGFSDGRLRFEPSQGPALVRNAAKAPKPMRRTLRLTGTQLSTLESFWTNDLDGGALVFDHEDPVTDTTVSVRIVELESAQAIVGGATAAERQWRVALTLEIMP